MRIERALALARPIVVATLIIGLTSVPSVHGQLSPPEQQAKLTPGQPATAFGQSVAASGDTVIVGADGIGAAYVYLRSGFTWNAQGTLVPPDPTGIDYFGHSVGLQGDTAVVGAPNNAGKGAAYVFVRHGSNWNFEAKLTPNDAMPGQYFGFAVAVSGDTVVVSAISDAHAGTNSGAGYVFTRSGASWSQQAKLIADDGSAFDTFGYSVALDANTAVVGAWLDDVAPFGHSGSAYVFSRDGTSWHQEAKLTATVPASDQFFGVSVALAGDTALVGAYGDMAYEGSAYVFQRSGSTWTPQAKLVASDGATQDFFGSSVALRGDVAAIGAYGTNVFAGSAYLFARTVSHWNQLFELTASDGTASEYFGAAIAVTSDTLAAGALHDEPEGSVYVYVFKAVGTWAYLGGGVTGSSGVPALDPTGYLVASSAIALSLSQAKPFSLAPLVVGLSNLSAPFKGGVLVPYPNYIFPAFTDFFGKATFGGLWPAGVPSGFTTYFQWWIQDPAGPQGYAASNAVAGTAP